MQQHGWIARHSEWKKLYTKGHMLYTMPFILNSRTSRTNLFWEKKYLETAVACVGGGNGRSLRELPGVMIMCHYLMSCDSSMGETLMHCIMSSFYLKGKKKTINRNQNGVMV